VDAALSHDDTVQGPVRIDLAGIARAALIQKVRSVPETFSLELMIYFAGLYINGVQPSVCRSVVRQVADKCWR
jgi:hypothetical protein